MGGDQSSEAGAPEAAGDEMNALPPTLPLTTTGSAAAENPTINIEITSISLPSTVPFNPACPPRRVQNVRDYLLLSVKQRGCVGMKEIGTKHGPLDVALCACLGLPGIVYAATATLEPLWLRILVAVEFIIVGAASVVADGLLLRQSTDSSNRNGLLFIDRKTAVLHTITLVGMFVYRGVGGFASPAQLGIAVGLAVPTMAFFHARLYFTFVRQEWRPARACARIWHVGGTVAPLVGLLPRLL